jgi:hypothetical protein
MPNVETQIALARVLPFPSQGSKDINGLLNPLSQKPSLELSKIIAL